MPILSGNRWPRSRTALALVAVFCAECVLFWWATARHHAWIYPRWYDQVQYLRDAYNAYDVARTQGFFAGASAALGHVSPQGALHGFLGLVSFVLLGPGRNAALAVNIAAFIGLQAVTFAAVCRVSGSRAISWAAIGLMAALQVPWSGEAGSAADFRLDWLSACLFGIALGSALLTEGFRSTRGAVLFGFALGALVLTRFLSAVYISLIVAAWLGWLLARPGRTRRVSRLLLSCAIAAGLSGWAFWRARHRIYEYYWVGHYSGPERALRDSHLTLAQALAWLAKGVLVTHMGVAALVIAGVAAGVFFFFRDRRSPGRTLPVTAWLPVLLFVAAPAAVLLSHPEKSLAPLEIVLIPATWVILLAWIGLARRVDERIQGRVGAAVAVLGFGTFALAQLRDPVPGPLRDEYRDINAVSDYLYFRSEEAGLTHPRLAVTWLVDGMGAEAFSVMGRERHGRRLPFVETLPIGIFEPQESSVWQRLPDSDFVILVTRAAENWPFDGYMRAMLPRTSPWCEANLRRVGSVDEPEFAAVIYERPTLARGPVGKETDFGAILAAERASPVQAPPRPPTAPFVPPTGTMLWSDRVDMELAVRAAYSPYHISAAGLPEGISLEQATGHLRGRFAHAGEWATDVTVSNELGSCTETLRFSVVDAEFDARVSGPARCVVGEMAPIGISACDASGSLDFVDVTDLTEAKALKRIETTEETKRSWTGTCPVSFSNPGKHVLSARIVRYHAGDPEPYSYIDRTLTVDVRPAERVKGR